MNKSEKKNPSGWFIFLMGFMTGILSTAVNSIFRHWPEIKKVILSVWN